ncbi:hypothetical protein MNKW57_06030 [Biformimicrobium ophioploci]|uniref:Uncharacterized protein n=2 Tax=Biformimicrobium ophioploci TaxID=3036711 RepID=A0ABQ6LW13_9GAMM|nr:hypothetical protein MNKW57_06030 [Microbulbifer sp. NKW57]
MTGALLLTSAVQAEAVPLQSDASFCAEVQRFIVGTDLDVKTTLFAPDTYESTFKESKAGARPLDSQQYVGYQHADGTASDYPVTVSCKMKTAERVRTAYADQPGVKVADDDRTCREWTELMVQGMYEKLEGQYAGQLRARDSIVVVEEDSTYIGPLWLRPFPYQAAVADGERLLLGSKSLHVEYRRFMPVPRSFMGTHYCHLIAPEYLQRLLLGQATALPKQD